MGKGDRKKKKKKKKKKNKNNINKKLPQKRNEKTIVSNNLKDLRKVKNDSLERKMSFEITNEKLIYDENRIFHFLKWASKYKTLDGSKIKDMGGDDFKNTFMFADVSNKNDKKYKNLKNTEFALEWFKQRINHTKIYNIDKTHVKNTSGIIAENSLQTEVNKLIPFSCILQAKVKLKSPYFSHDDDEFYVIQNSILKEKVFKVPMIRGSGWKGAIANAGKKLLNDDLSYFESFVRILGTGSQEYRELLDELGKDKNIKDKIISYTLFELGLKLDKSSIEKINKKPKDFLKDLSGKFTKENIKKIPFLQTHKGRAIFYPTYFNKLSLEIINPHNRKTRAGTNPMHYEVVPKGTEGILQVVYIPYDGILTPDKDLQKQVEKDIKYLTECINKTAELGIGAKTKLGWGRFEFEKKEYSINGAIGNLETDWERYEEKKQ